MPDTPPSIPTHLRRNLTINDELHAILSSLPPFPCTDHRDAARPASFNN